MWVTNYSMNVTTNNNDYVRRLFHSNTTISGDYFTQTTTWDEAFNPKTSAKIDEIERQASDKQATNKTS